MVVVVVLLGCTHLPQHVRGHDGQCPPRVLVLCVFARCHYMTQPLEPAQKKTPPDGGAE
jgi:hypothetical protein